MIKEYIEKIVKKGKQEDMEKLSDILDNAILAIKEDKPEKYKEYKKELCGMAYDYKFDKDFAEKIVNEMQPLGEKWSMNETSQARRQYGITADDIDFYIVMNSLANDYSNVIDTSQIDVYSKMAEAFINDEDAVENKVWEYFTNIVA